MSGYCSQCGQTGGCDCNSLTTKADDDAPELTPELAARGQISIGDKVVREATGTVMTDEIERVARAIAAAEWKRDARLRHLEKAVGDTAERYAERSWGLWMGHATAAIAAMPERLREPATGDGDDGRLPAAPGHSAEPEPKVSAVPASVPSAIWQLARQIDDRKTARAEGHITGTYICLSPEDAAEIVAAWERLAL